MTINYQGGFKLHAETRGHKLVSDQPLEKRGEDSGPTPPELFIFSLGACIGVYARFFAERHNISLEGMNIEMEWEKAENPSRIGAIRARIIIPGGVPERFRSPLLKSACSCLIHNTITHSAEIEINLAD
jgi:uncharacterized OsmC-like protein